MRLLTTLLATPILVALGSASASAGPCAQQITELTKQLAASDAGAGPTGASPAPTAGEQKGQHPPTAIMGEQAGGRALSPGDTQRESGVRSGASNALALARKLDAQDRPECKDAVDLASELSKL
jgi:hypothetical protein